MPTERLRSQWKTTSNLRTNFYSAYEPTSTVPTKQLQRNLQSNLNSAYKAISTVPTKQFNGAYKAIYICVEATKLWLARGKQRKAA